MLNNRASVEGTSINLARIAPFRLGALDVLPATRQLERSGKSENLEPRVMQVLVALAKAQSAVVTRDDLIASCWDGRVVGDNAIHRTISRLRDISSGIGEGCFRLETVNKVGYRLITVEAVPQMAEVSPSANSSGQRPRAYRALMFGAVTLALAAMIAMVAWTQAPASAVTTIALVSQDPRSTDLADGLTVDLAHLANIRSNRLVFADGAERYRADYLLKIARQDSTGGARADVSLLKPHSTDVLWSASFAARTADPAALRAQIANAVFWAARCALQTNNDPAHADREALLLVFSSCERLYVYDDADNNGVEQWRKIAARNPRNARALATLAWLEATWADFGVRILATMAPQQGASLRAAAKDHLRKARDIDPSLGLTYAAEAFMLPHWRYADELAVLNRGLAADPDCAQLYLMKAQVLQGVGRIDDALDNARTAAEFEPSSPSSRTKLGLTLAYAGYTQAARTELETAERIWPDAQIVHQARFNFEYRFGDPKMLLRQMDGGSLPQPYGSTSFQNGVMRAFVLARLDRSPSNVAQAVNLAFAFPNAPYGVVQNLVALGQLDMSFTFLNNPLRVAQFQTGETDVLFRVYMRPLLFDRRFMAFADRIGLVRFWQTSGLWPDFCSDRNVAYNCRTEARRWRVKAA